MLQTETSKKRKIKFDEYHAKYIVNRELEWLIEEGKIRESVYFKGETVIDIVFIWQLREIVIL